MILTKNAEPVIGYTGNETNHAIHAPISPMPIVCAVVLIDLIWAQERAAIIWIPGIFYMMRDREFYIGSAESVCINPGVA